MTTPHIRQGPHIRLFPTEQAYLDFCERFREAVKPELDRQREARRQSEESAMRHAVDAWK